MWTNVFYSVVDAVVIGLFQWMIGFFEMFVMLAYRCTHTGTLTVLLHIVSLCYLFPWGGWLVTHFLMPIMAIVWVECKSSIMLCCFKANMFGEKFLFVQERVCCVVKVFDCIDFIFSFVCVCLCLCFVFIAKVIIFVVAAFSHTHSHKHLSPAG